MLQAGRSLVQFQMRSLDCFQLTYSFQPHCDTGATHALAEMSTRNLPGGKEQPAYKADNLTAICELIIWKMWEPRCLTTLWASAACYRDSFAFTLFIIHFILIVKIRCF
jgi:hypothetical protein